MARVVVVGGGLGGTATAARLAKLGHSVTLVERQPRLGGAIGFVEEGGYRWDSGPVATALPAVLRDLFRKSGRPLEKELELVPVEPMREHRFADGSAVALPSGSRTAQIEAIDAGLGSGLGRQWADYTHTFADVWDRLRRDYLERPYSPGHAAKETEQILRSRLTMHKAVTRTFRDERLRTLALHHTVQGGHDPRNAPAWTGLLDYLEQNLGTWTVPGGFGRVAEALTKRLSERGVEVLLGTTALDVAMGTGGPAAVETSAGPVAAEVVVCAIDPRRLPALAPFVKRTMPALPPTVTHLGLAGTLPDLPSEVVLHGEATITVRTGGQAPPGHAAWTLIGRGRISEDLLVAMARQHLDLRDNVEVRVDRSPLHLVEQYSGSPYGVLWQGRATLSDRLGTTTPLPGVYCAGAHVAAGGNVPFTGLTAALVAQAVGPNRPS